MKTTPTIQAGERTQHTPGPWRVDPEYNEDIQTEDGQLEIAGTSPQILLGGIKPTSQFERHANARLIAAAPELLEALKALVTGASLMEGVDSDSCFPDSNGITIRDIRSLIAKAEGMDSTQMSRS